MNKQIKNMDWKSKLKELKKEKHIKGRPCMEMSKEQFNMLMRDYQKIKPNLTYQKRKRNLQAIIDLSSERRYISSKLLYSSIKKRYAIALGSYCELGSHHTLSFIDRVLDDTLDLMGPIDLS